MALDSVSDIRKDKEFEFLIDEYDKYNRYVNIPVKLQNSNNLFDYIENAKKIEDSVLIILLNGDTTINISSATRDRLKQMGLEVLSHVSDNEAYIGIITNGEITKEISESNNKKDSYTQFSWREKGIDFMINSRTEDIDSGYFSGSEIMIDEKAFPLDKRGVNILVYDTLDNKVLDIAYFDTYVGEYRVTDVDEWINYEITKGVKYDDFAEPYKKYLNYQRKKDNKSRVNKVNAYDKIYLKDYLEVFSEDDYCIVLSVMGDAANGMNEAARNWLDAYGLKVLSKINYQDSYVGIILDGQVKQEYCQNNDPIVIEGLEYLIISGGENSGNISSIMINHKEYSEMKQGINFVVYDKLLNEVIIHGNLEAF